MSSTFSTNLKFELIGAGEQSGAWNNTTNTNIGTLIEQAICGVVELTLAGTADYTVEYADGAESEARNMVLILAGSPTGTCNVITPNVERMYVVRNTTSYAHTIKTASGTGVSIPANSSSLVFSNSSGSGVFYNAIEEIASGATAGGVEIATISGTQTLTNKTLTSPTVNGGTITGITDLAVADGGTGASDASGARTNLGLGTIATQAASSVSITGGSITGITDLAIADGGTGASTASGARTNLDVNQAGSLSGVASVASSYTLVLTDRGKIVEMNSGSAQTITVPPASSVAFPVGTIINLISIGVGQTSIAPGLGVTITSYGTKRKLTGQYSMATLINISSDVWRLAGDLIG